MICVDKQGHVISDTSEDELHSFAFKTGLKRGQYVRGRFPRYNCSSVEQISYITMMGARFISVRETVLKLRHIREEKLKLEGFNKDGVRIYKCKEELMKDVEY